MGEPQEERRSSAGWASRFSGTQQLRGHMALLWPTSMAPHAARPGLAPHASKQSTAQRSAAQHSIANAPPAPRARVPATASLATALPVRV